MLNTHSMSRTFRNWCEQSNLMAIPNKYLEADGTIKQQYVTADNGVEHNHNQATALDASADGNSRQQCGQWHRLAMDKPIMHFSVTMTVENDGR
eukprot:6320096-Amphidinium_carterae.2